MVTSNIHDLFIRSFIHSFFHSVAYLYRAGTHLTTMPLTVYIHVYVC